MLVIDQADAIANDAPCVATQPITFPPFTFQQNFTPNFFIPGSHMPPFAPAEA